ncbi:MAG: hypothetical protein ACK4WH_08250 [Phycisphaerales bacterium]
MLLLLVGAVISWAIAAVESVFSDRYWDIRDTGRVNPLTGVFSLGKSATLKFEPMLPKPYRVRSDAPAWQLFIVDRITKRDEALDAFTVIDRARFGFPFRCWAAWYETLWYGPNYKEGQSPFGMMGNAYPRIGIPAGYYYIPMIDSMNPGKATGYRLIPVVPTLTTLLANAAFWGWGPWLVWASVRQARVLIRRRAGCCLRCGYSLRGLTTRRCPECGTAWGTR